ncbi:MAG: major capsid protein [Ghiorsea sp.]
MPFQPKTMIGVLNQIKPTSTFLKDTFFKGKKTHATRSIELDIIKGRRRLAPFVSPHMEGVLVDRNAAASHTITMPYIKQKMVTEAGMLINQRTAGQTIYEGTPQKRGQALLAGDLVTLRDMVTRREEAMAAEALVFGKVTVLGEGVDQVVNFLRPATHQLVNTATANAWDAAGIDIPAQLRNHARTIAQTSGQTATVCVMGNGAATAFLNNAKVLALLDNRRLDSGQIKVESIGAGASYLGYFQGIDFYEYNEWAEDANGVEQPLVAANQVVFGSPSKDNTMHYGAIQDLKAGNWAVPYFAKSWEEEDPSMRFLMVQSAPLPAIHHIESVMSITAL